MGRRLWDGGLELVDKRSAVNYNETHPMRGGVLRQLCFPRGISCVVTILKLNAETNKGWNVASGFTVDMCLNAFMYLCLQKRNMSQFPSD